MTRGVHNLNALPPSRYSMTVEKDGFKKKVLEDVGVIAEQSNAVNVQLDLGQSSEMVTVTGDATPLIDTETSNVSGTVTSQQIQALPSFGRDVFQLLQPSDVHNPNGYAANPNAIVTFGLDNLPTTCCTDLTALAADVPTTYGLHYTLGAEYDLGHQWVASVAGDAGAVIEVVVLHQVARLAPLISRSTQLSTASRFMGMTAMRASTPCCWKQSILSAAPSCWTRSIA
jgi:hypothetical protein